MISGNFSDEYLSINSDFGPDVLYHNFYALCVSNGVEMIPVNWLSIQVVFTLGVKRIVSGDDYYYTKEWLDYRMHLQQEARAQLKLNFRF
jgi:hypothetical protein